MEFPPPSIYYDLGAHTPKQRARATSAGSQSPQASNKSSQHVLNGSSKLSIRTDQSSFTFPHQSSESPSLQAGPGAETPFYTPTSSLTRAGPSRTPSNNLLEVPSFQPSRRPKPKIGEERRRSSTSHIPHAQLPGEEEKVKWWARGPGLMGFQHAHMGHSLHPTPAAVIRDNGGMGYFRTESPVPISTKPSIEGLSQYPTTGFDRRRGSGPSWDADQLGEMLSRPIRPRNRADRISEGVEVDSDHLSPLKEDPSPVGSNLEKQTEWDVFEEMRREKKRTGVRPEIIPPLIPPLVKSLNDLSLRLTTRQRSVNHTLEEYINLSTRFIDIDKRAVDLWRSLGFNVPEDGLASTDTQNVDMSVIPEHARTDEANGSGSQSSRPRDTASTNPGDEPRAPGLNPIQSSHPTALAQLEAFEKTIRATRSGVESLQDSLSDKNYKMAAIEEEMGRIVPAILDEINRRVEERENAIERVQRERVKRERFIFSATVVGVLAIVICCLALYMQ